MTLAEMMTDDGEMIPEEGMTVAVMTATTKDGVAETMTTEAKNSYA